MSGPSLHPRCFGARKKGRARDLVLRCDIRPSWIPSLSEPLPDHPPVWEREKVARIAGARKLLLIAHASYKSGEQYRSLINEEG